MSPEKTGTHQPVIDILYSISSLVGNTDDPGEALNQILNNVVQVLNASSASISLINPDSNKLEIEVHKGLPADSRNFSLSMGQGVTGWVALHGEPILVKDVRLEQRYYTLKETVRSELAVPMLVDGSPIGVVNVDSETVAAFNEQDLKLLTLITNEATKVVSRLWLINQLKKKADQLESLLQVSQQVVKKLEIQELLDSITQQARTLMDVRVCAIFLLSENRETLQLHSLNGSSGKIEYSEEIALIDSSVGVAIRRNKQVTVFDLKRTEEHHFIELSQSEGLSSLLCTPITFENEVIGVLNAYTHHIHRFNNEEKKLFATLASLSAVAIQNSRLYSRVFSSEESLRKNERLTTLGLLAAEIAHEVRNPLTVIKLLFDALDLNFPQSDARAQDVEVIKERISHLEEIVGNVLNFGKSKTELHSRWNLAELIDDTLRLVRLKLQQSKVAINYRIPSKPIFVEVHKGQMQQVILNLLINAVQAMPRGGTITITLSLDEANLVPCAIIQVKDTGNGIPEKIAPKIFESFLTSRKDGTGLGLSICKRIMKQHRGDIKLAETTYQGTTFELHLPII